MKEGKVYDIIGIGIGPFNLGLAAMSDSVPELKTIFFEQNNSFEWHPGLMLNRARLQVPFYADLVTLADPCSRYSYMSFLKDKRRMFRFAIHEHNYVTRQEYNEYCKWVAGQLSSLYFGYRCEAIKYDEAEKVYTVYVKEVFSLMTAVYKGRNLVIGTGTAASYPDFLEESDIAKFREGGRLIFHSGDYLKYKEALLKKKSVTIIGSGQSAGEIFHDLLGDSFRFTKGLNWITRSERFHPMDVSKLNFELTSPEYTDYFFELKPEKKKEVLSRQQVLYSGINAGLISEIYDELYLKSISGEEHPIKLISNSVLSKVYEATENEIVLEFFRPDLETRFTNCAEAVILGTGYRSVIPDFLNQIKGLIRITEAGKYDVSRGYTIDENQSIFVQNAEMHTHGFSTPDLGMGPYRNSVILNSISGKSHFVVDKANPFQTFGL